MEYTNEMNLISPSGYCMPYLVNDGEQVKVLLGYGEQLHPKNGEAFFHHGIDFETKNVPLRAVGSGFVTGVNSDMVHGLSLTVHYSNNGSNSREGYDVTYSHVAEAKVNWGNRVNASDIIALSSNLLHLEVRFNGEEIDPSLFLSMIYGNISTLEQEGKENPAVATLDMETHTKYDKDEPELSQMMGKYMGSYLKDVALGNYQVPKNTAECLTEAFQSGKRNNLFFDVMPSMLNPLGLGTRAIALIQLIQEILIGDFLSYMAMKHRTFLSSMGEDEKKNLLHG